MTAKFDATTSIFELPPQYSHTKVLNLRRKRRDVSRQAASLIDWHDSNDALYFSKWENIANPENTAAIADAVEQFTPDEIAAFIVSLVKKAACYE